MLYNICDIFYFHLTTKRIVIINNYKFLSKKKNIKYYFAKKINNFNDYIFFKHQ